MRSAEIKIGVLDIQGSVKEHMAALKKCGVKVLLVKNTDDLARIDGLIIPGGESTHINMMLEKNGLFDVIKKRIRGNMPVMGTCAGAVLLAKNNLGAIDIKVERNAYGRQIDSFETSVKIPVLNQHGEKSRNFNAIFIRAPKIKKIGRGVEILAKLKNEIIMARQKNILVLTFHPELTNDLRVHKYFIEMTIR